MKSADVCVRPACAAAALFTSGAAEAPALDDES